MLKHSATPTLSLALLAAGSGLPLLAQAAFIEDGKASLTLNNFYFNSDYRQPGATQSKREEWAQGFMLDYQSGFTEGTLGFGVDAIGMLGVKLDSSADRINTGLLSADNAGNPQDEYSELGLTAKVRLSKSILRVGTLIPKLPTVLPNDSRLLPQTFRGAHLNSREIDGLTLDAGRLTHNSQRNDSSSEDMIVSGQAIGGGRFSDAFDFAGASYQWREGLTTSYNYARLEDNYRQHIVNLVHALPLGAGSLKSDLRYARSSDDGTSNVDNTALGALFTYSLSGHALSLAYQKMRGDTGFPYLNGTDAFLVNFVMLAPDFANPDEKSWQARYSYDFAAMGIPGLTFMTRYVRGDGFERGGRSAREWERNSDIGYAFQDGRLKNFAVKWRNGTYRSSGGNDIDQNRLILSYTLPLL
ncbi:OprD family porin [Phytopseudomonas dryadis]|uniref:Outer membrane porin, OprD family n=1 Tax=Phytopseudomonas dryadis TaxID=2487520 RepID=A0A4Q9QYU3_9GAMM|nr:MULTISPECIES: OprD family porin [Pseudomonas]TBU90306.1 outer membrane porin, OprD family [Pseudomonas dryadis]TBV04438.1 outer membrane porin, OprD family [Pseudomonas dryadis]TBV17164.1 outer membrane porin, OprD family [Pseudomonas sp. FRB 230]